MGVGPGFEPKNTQNHAFFLQFYVYKLPSRNDPKAFRATERKLGMHFLKLRIKSRFFRNSSMESLINCARFKPCFFSTISNSAASFTFIKRVRGAPAHARADVHARYMHARARARTCANLSFGRTDGRLARTKDKIFYVLLKPNGLFPTP